MREINVKDFFRIKPLKIETNWKHSKSEQQLNHYRIISFTHSFIKKCGKVFDRNSKAIAKL